MGFRAKVCTQVWFQSLSSVFTIVLSLASLMAQLVKKPPAMWFNPWVGKIPWSREQLPIPVFWPGEFHGLYSPCGGKESDMTERRSLSLFTFGRKSGKSWKSHQRKLNRKLTKWRRKWQPAPVSLQGKFHGWRSLTGYNPCGCKESDMTEQPHSPTLNYISIFCFYFSCFSLFHVV